MLFLDLNLSTEINKENLFVVLSQIRITDGKTIHIFLV